MPARHNRTVPPSTSPRIDAWIADAAEQLNRVGVEAAKLEAQLLAAHSLGRDRTWVLAHPEQDVPPAAEELLGRRLRHEPLAYILGWREFYGRRFAVRPGVLIPRHETEVLVEAALERIPVGSDLRILDIGVGSGAIAITLALDRPACQVFGVDLSPDALEIAAENARSLNTDVALHEADLFPPGPTVFDLIVSNPPYVAYGDPIGADVVFEPDLALYAGGDGLEVLRRLAAEAPAYLVAEGELLVEIGAGQEGAVEAIFAAKEWTKQDARRDFGGHLRVLVFRRPA